MNFTLNLRNRFVFKFKFVEFQNKGILILYAIRNYRLEIIAGNISFDHPSSHYFTILGFFFVNLYKY